MRKILAIIMFLSLVAVSSAKAQYPIYAPIYTPIPVAPYYPQPYNPYPYYPAVPYYQPLNPYYYPLPQTSIYLIPVVPRYYWNGYSLVQY